MAFPITDILTSLLTYLVEVLVVEGHRFFAVDVLAGGDRKTLARGNHVVENCHIHHFAKVLKTYHPGVSLQGVGHRASHCFIHDCHMEASATAATTT